jgi:hypothetical protein
MRLTSLTIFALCVLGLVPAQAQNSPPQFSVAGVPAWSLKVGNGALNFSSGVYIVDNNKSRVTFCEVTADSGGNRRWLCMPWNDLPQ